MTPEFAAETNGIPPICRRIIYIWLSVDCHRNQSRNIDTYIRKSKNGIILLLAVVYLQGCQIEYYLNNVVLVLVIGEKVHLFETRRKAYSTFFIFHCWFINLQLKPTNKIINKWHTFRKEISYFAGQKYSTNFYWRWLWRFAYLRICGRGPFESVCVLFMFSSCRWLPVL